MKYPFLRIDKNLLLKIFISKIQSHFPQSSWRKEMLFLFFSKCFSVSIVKKFFLFYLFIACLHLSKLSMKRFIHFQVQLEIRKKWRRLWSKPDLVYLQQSQHLHDERNGSRLLRRSSRNASENRASSEVTSDAEGCLCKWTLDKNGKLTRTFVKTGTIKAKQQTKQILFGKETQM